MTSDELVSIALPVFNGVEHLESVAKSVLAQDYERLELVISDNASTDGTEEVGRGLAAADRRVVYHRQARNVGLLNNFVHAMRVARGGYIRWIGDDDWIAPNYVSRCLEEFAGDSRLVLVTTRMAYTGDDGVTRIGSRQSEPLGSDDPVERFAEVVRLLTEGYLNIDPLYALIKRDVIVGIGRRNMLREDEVFATKLALAGAWGHVPEVLAHRHWATTTRLGNARLLDVPAWRNGISSFLQCKEILEWLSKTDLTPEQRGRARSVVAKLYLRRKQCALQRGRRKLVRIASGAVRSS